MSNFSSIGVSVYEITHDCRVTWLFGPAYPARVHTGHMKDAKPRRSPEPGSPPVPAPVTLPPEMTSALAAFERHLRSERSLSAHTVRAYLGDIRSLLEYATRQGAGSSASGSRPVPRPASDRRRSIRARPTASIVTVR